MDLLATPTGLDLATLKLRVVQRAPAVIARLSRVAAERSAHVIRSRGGDAFPCTTADLERLGEALELRAVGVSEGRLTLTLSAGPQCDLRPSEITTLVRAQTVRATATPSNRETRMSSIAKMNPIVRKARIEADTAYDRSVTTWEYLDIHTNANMLFRVDGKRFAFDVLGDVRGHSVKANTDKLFELLKHLTPNAVHDDFFKLWKPIPDCLRVKSSVLTKKGSSRELRAFEFYSRWVRCLYRHVLGA